MRAEEATTLRMLFACFVLAWLLAALMAALSATNAHPDEIFHLGAGRYYLDHWLPPRMTEAELLPSLSKYGYTYLGEVDISYFFAGKLARLLSFAVPGETLCFRAFNLALFGALVARYAARREAFSPLVVLLLTPQVWYVFSYFNNDAFPLFLSLLLVDQLFGARARVGAALSEAWSAASLRRLAATGVLLGLLALTKSNYLPVLGFVGFVAMWRGFGLAAAVIAVAGAAVKLALSRGFVSLPPRAASAMLAGGAAALLALVAARLLRSPPLRGVLARAALVAIAAIAVVAPPLAYDRAVNGPSNEKNGALSVIAEAHADPAYRPSNAANAESFFGLHLRDKGVTLAQVLLPPWSWATKSWKSFAGWYGYMTIKSPNAYYLALFAVDALLAATIAAALLLRGAPGDRWLLGIVAGFGAGTIAISLYHSWVNDFQAQGRYLFPALALAAIPFTRGAPLAGARVVRGFVAIAFALSVFSFGYVGLMRIARATVP
jgi:hypothetical protein